MVWPRHRRYTAAGPAHGRGAGTWPHTNVTWPLHRCFSRLRYILEVVANSHGAGITRPRRRHMPATLVRGRGTVTGPRRPSPNRGTVTCPRRRHMAAAPSHGRGAAVAWPRHRYVVATPTHGWVLHGRVAVPWPRRRRLTAAPLHGDGAINSTRSRYLLRGRSVFTWPCHRRNAVVWYMPAVPLYVHNAVTDRGTVTRSKRWYYTTVPRYRHLAVVPLHDRDTDKWAVHERGGIAWPRRRH